eukprot:6167031-Pleurochrysis_carterae.AAC.4
MVHTRAPRMRLRFFRALHVAVASARRICTDAAIVVETTDSPRSVLSAQCDRNALRQSFTVEHKLLHKRGSVNDSRTVMHRSVEPRPLVHARRSASTVSHRFRLGTSRSLDPEMRTKQAASTKDRRERNAFKGPEDRLLASEGRRQRNLLAIATAPISLLRRPRQRIPQQQDVRNKYLYFSAGPAFDCRECIKGTLWVSSLHWCVIRIRSCTSTCACVRACACVCVRVCARARVRQRERMRARVRARRGEPATARVLAALTAATLSKFR